MIKTATIRTVLTLAISVSWTPVMPFYMDILMYLFTCPNPRVLRIRLTLIMFVFFVTPFMVFVKLLVLGMTPCVWHFRALASLAPRQTRLYLLSILVVIN